MDKKARIAAISALVVVMSIVAIMVFAAPKQCNNGSDDDNDGLVDYPADPGCSAANDNSETSVSLVCDDGADQANDRDVLADSRLSSGDPGCSSVTDSSEIDGDCDDLDDEANDRDSLTDSTDPGCTSTSDASEVDGECDDLSDNADTDSLIDYQVSGGDPGCVGTSDLSEVDGDCDDGTDNDNDGLADLSDPGCTGTSDSSELGTGVCDDGVDQANDADALADFRVSSGDPGCVSATDLSERDGPCDDTFDNDGDSFADYLVDPECGGYADVEHDCTDSDGFTITVQGTTSGSYGGNPFNVVDSCFDGTTVTENYCTPYNLGSQNVACTNTTSACVSGACV